MPTNADVDAWFESYDNPMKPVVLAIRDVILGVDARMGECIKWKAPTFTFEGNLASLFPKSKKHASLLFHQGAKIPGKHPLMEGTGETSRVIKLGTVAEVKKAKKQIQAIVKAWIKLKEGGAKKKTAAKRR